MQIAQLEHKMKKLVVKNTEISMKKIEDRDYILKLPTQNQGIKPE